eukprot:362306-Chlamydomonas_euryale.AAC.7
MPLYTCADHPPLLTAAQMCRLDLPNPVSTARRWPGCWMLRLLRSAVLGCRVYLGKAMRVSEAG